MKNNVNNDSGTIFQEPFKLLYLLIPILLGSLLATILMGAGTMLTILTWVLMLMVIGFAALPFSAYLFRNFRSGGFFLSQPLGLTGVSFIVWTLTYIGIFKFSVPFIIASIILIGALCYGIKPLRENLITTLSRKGIIENIALEEAIFFLLFTVLCYFKGFLPDINGQEKFMDYGFIMSMLRNSRLPANDMWLSGHTINYYYFGQFIYTLLIKLSGIKSSVGYNLSMCSAIAIPFSCCYAIGHMLIESATHFGMRCRKVSAVVSGLLCAFAAIIFGNSHSFFYDETSPGNRILGLFAKLGINVGNTGDYYYPNSTRFIGYNPDSKFIEGIQNGGDYTIEEFPFYSYLVGDLHAHVVSTMIVLLIAAVALSLIDSLEFKRVVPPLGIKKTYKNLISVQTVTLAVLLGCAQMTNYWDFLIYFIFLAMTLLVYNTRTTKKFSTLAGVVMFFSTIVMILLGYLTVGDKPGIHVLIQIVILAMAYIATSLFDCALTRTSLGMSFFFTAANIVALPFNLSFDMISNKIAKCVNHTSLYQLYILWGTHVIICVGFIIFTIIEKNYKTAEDASVIVNNELMEGTDPVTRFFAQRNAADIFVCGMAIVGILMLIAPEIFYVRDIYTGGYLRANTMFKFTYAAFIILSVCIGYIIPRLYRIVNKKGFYSNISFAVMVVFALMILVPAHYPFTALSQRCRGKEFKTLDGTSYLDTYSSSASPVKESGNLTEYRDAIDWFNTEVPGTPIIMEAYGMSYTDYNIVSAYTGLPTVCGWSTHETLWRYHGVVDRTTNLLVSDPNNDVKTLYIIPRHSDIMTVYTSQSADEIREILNNYNVEYVIIGDIERDAYGYDNTERIASLGTVAFTSGDLTVVRIEPTL